MTPETVAAAPLVFVVAALIGLAATALTHLFRARTGPTSTEETP
ncbi:MULTISPECIES: hypothetical protein [unclassified Mycobacterium]|nr:MULTISPECIES: hypothetical protein [unclassified Mycobacterium]